MLCVLTCFFPAAFWLDITSRNSCDSNFTLYSCWCYCNFIGAALLAHYSPIQLHFSRKLGQVRKITAGWTDKRMKTTSEIFSGILSIKAFVWETPFSTLN